MNGWLALPMTEIKAWCEMTGEVLRPEEVRMIRAMDQAFLDATRLRSDEEGKLIEHSSEPLTTAVFDAMFG